jgi:hypothetical protein
MLYRQPDTAPPPAPPPPPPPDCPPGNDFSTLYAPLIRDGRMEKFYWEPEKEDIVNIVHQVGNKGGGW